MENYTELEDMRIQLAALKEKIANQEIVNDRMLRNAVASKMSGIHRLRNKVLILGVVALAINAPYMYFMGFSPYLVVYTVVMLLFSMYKTYQYHEKVENSNVYNGDLLAAVKELKTLKEKYNQSYWYSVPMAIVYIVWFIYELRLKYDSDFAGSLVAGVIVGGLIGFIWGVMMNRKLIKMCDDIIRQIEE